MKWIGLTGGIATGKSSVAQVLREMGYPVVDADELAREVVKPGSLGLEKVVLAFGRGILDEKGHLSRPTLGQIIFKDPVAREKLEQILHPLIQEMRAKLRSELERESIDLAFYDVPLLFEKNMHDEFDATVLVYAKPSIQKQRLAERNKFSDKEIELRLASQLPIDEKVKRANYIIFNEATLKDLKGAVLAVVNDILSGT